MPKVMMKLKEGAARQFLTTPSGYTIEQKEYTEVDDQDPHIQSFLLNRSDILIKEPSKKLKGSGKAKNKETFVESKKEKQEDKKEDDAS